MQKKNVLWIDIVKAILILLVVIGHSNCSERIIQIIFWFHMPVFFMVSGYLLSMPTNNYYQWIIRKIKRFLIPYACYYIMIALLNNDFSLKSILLMVYGGRKINGVYWYITVLFLSEIVILLIEKIQSFKIKIGILGSCYLLAIAESYFLIPSEPAHIPTWLMLPWDMDVVLIAVVYLGIGYYGKSIIQKYAYSIDGYEKKSIFLMCGSIVLFWTLIINLNSFYVDMKYGNYCNLILNLLVPVICGIAISGISVFLSKIKYLNKILSYIGSRSMVVMYMHLFIKENIVIPIWGESYNLWIYLTIVLLGSVLFEFAANRLRITQLVFLGK